MVTDMLYRLVRRGYALLFMLVFLVYDCIAFLAPVLMHFGYELPARLIYKIYSLLCHQLPYRSFFLFGEQHFYPLAKAKMDPQISTFSAMAGKDFDSFSDIRAFIGNSQMGYKTALCQRDIAIFLALAFFCLVFFLLNNHLPRLHWSLWIILGLLPMALDGGSQMLSDLLPKVFTPRESTPYLRVITGAMFAIFTAWFLFPRLEESLGQTDNLTTNGAK